MNTTLSNQNEKSYLLTNGQYLVVKQSRIDKDARFDAGKRTYKAFYSGTPDGQGFEGDSGIMEKGETLGSIAKKLVKRIEEAIAIAKKEGVSFIEL